MTRPSEDHPDLRRAPATAESSPQETLRWYVHRMYRRPTRLGEYRPTVQWVVTPITGGRGSNGTPVGNPLPFANRSSALAFAHRLATRTYRPGKARP